MSFALLLLSILACEGEKEEAVAAPTVSWLTPTDGQTLTAGDVECSIIVENFTLETPTLHSTGAPDGYAEITVDGALATDEGDSTFTLTLEAGEHTLSAQLFYADGDEILVSGEELCDEDAADGCEPVLASVGVTVE